MPIRALGAAPGPHAGSPSIWTDLTLPSMPPARQVASVPLTRNDDATACPRRRRCRCSATRLAEDEPLVTLPAVPRAPLVGARDARDPANQAGGTVDAPPQDGRR